LHGCLAEDFLQISSVDCSMVNPFDLVNKYVSFVGMDFSQASSCMVSYNPMLKFGFGLPVIEEISSLNVLVDEKASYYEK